MTERLSMHLQVRSWVWVPVPHPSGGRQSTWLQRKFQALPLKRVKHQAQLACCQVTKNSFPKLVIKKEGPRKINRMTNSREIEVYLGNQRELREKKKSFIVPTLPQDHYPPTCLQSRRVELSKPTHSNHRSHLTPTFTNNSKITGKKQGQTWHFFQEKPLSVRHSFLKCLFLPPKNAFFSDF